MQYGVPLKVTQAAVIQIRLALLCSFSNHPPSLQLRLSPFNMQLIKQAIERDGSGSVTLQPEEQEDMVRPRSPSPQILPR